MCLSPSICVSSGMSVPSSNIFLDNSPIQGSQIRGQVGQILGFFRSYVGTVFIWLTEYKISYQSNLYLYRSENMCVCVCVCIRVFLSHLESDWDNLWHNVAFWFRNGFNTKVYLIGALIN